MKINLKTIAKVYLVHKEGLLKHIEFKLTRCEKISAKVASCRLVQFREEWGVHVQIIFNMKVMLLALKLVGDSCTRFGYLIKNASVSYHVGEDGFSDGGSADVPC